MNADHAKVIRTKTGTSVLVAETSVSGTALVIQSPTNPLFAGVTAVLIGYALALFTASRVLPSSVVSGQTGHQDHSVASISASISQPGSDASTFYGNENPLTVYWDRRCIYGPMSSKARRKMRRTRAEIQEERRQLLEKTNREIDAIAREFHEKLPREKAEGIGSLYARYSSRFQDSLADQIRTLFEAAYQLKIFVPREQIYFDMAIRGYQDRRPGLAALQGDRRKAVQYLFGIRHEPAVPPHIQGTAICRRATRRKGDPRDLR